MARGVHWVLGMQGTGCAGCVGCWVHWVHWVLGVGTGCVACGVHGVLDVQGAGMRDSTQQLSVALPPPWGHGAVGTGLTGQQPALGFMKPISPWHTEPISPPALWWTVALWKCSHVPCSHRHPEPQPMAQLQHPLPCLLSITGEPSCQH